jgi:hypothetical protein
MNQEQPPPPPQPQAQPQSGTRTGSTTTRLPVSSSRRPNNHHHHQRDNRTTSTAVVRALAINESSGVPFGHVPAYLPGSSSLVEELDKRVLVVLRDGKHLIGVRTCGITKEGCRQQKQRRRPSHGQNCHSVAPLILT